MTAATPGRAARVDPADVYAIAAFGAWIGQTDTARILLSWQERSEEEHADWRKVAAAARHDLAAQDARPAPTSASQVRRYEAQPAPGLAAARDASDLEVAAVIAERNQLRMALQRLADNGGWNAREALAAIRPELTATASGPAPGLAAAMAVIAEYERLADRLVIPNRATRAEIRKHNGLGAP